MYARGCQNIKYGPAADCTSTEAEIKLCNRRRLYLVIYPVHGILTYSRYVRVVVRLVAEPVH